MAQRARILQAVLSVVTGALFAVGCVWLYFGVMMGGIDDTRWGIAFLVSTLGLRSLLDAGYFGLAGSLAAAAHFLFARAQIHTFDRTPEGHHD
jgi:hypothetical protein